MRRFFCRVEITVGPDKPPGDAGGKHQVKETKMGLFGKIATLAAIALPGKAIAASRGKTSAAGGTPPPPPPPKAGQNVYAAGAEFNKKTKPPVRNAWREGGK